MLFKAFLAYLSLITKNSSVAFSRNTFAFSTRLSMRFLGT